MTAFPIRNQGAKQGKAGGSESDGGLRPHTCEHTLPSKDEHSPLGPMRSHSDSWLRSQVLSEICITVPRTTAQGESDPQLSSKSRAQHTQPCMHSHAKDSTVAPHIPILGISISSPHWHLGDHSCLPGTFTSLWVILVSSCQVKCSGQLVNSPSSWA